MKATIKSRVTAMVSVEHPSNASDNIEEEFKTKYDLLKFIGGMGRLKKYMK